MKYLVLAVAALLLILFLMWRTIPAHASQVYSHTICHHTPGNQVTHTFHTLQAYLGHLGTPHSGSTYDTEGACPSSSPSPSPSSSPSVSPSASPSSTPEPCGDGDNDWDDKKCEEPSPTPSPSVTPEPSTSPEPSTTPAPSEEPVVRGLTAAGPPADCTDVSPTVGPANSHVYRKGDDAQVKWFPDLTLGDKVNIYYKQVGASDWQYSLTGVPNNGYAEIHGLGTMDITFATQLVKGCAAGPLTTPIVDGATDGWVLFR